MARNALLFASLAALAAAWIPPCLPGLGPEFCPSTASHNSYTVPHDPVVFPDLTQQDVLPHVFWRLNKTRMEADLRGLTDPKELPNRYCKSSFGQHAHKHVVNAVQRSLTSELGNQTSAPHSESFTVLNETPQLSYVLRIPVPGPDPKDLSPVHDTIVVGAHMDSINHKDEYNGSDTMVAPGADDNGTGTVVLIEVLRVLMPLFANKPVKNEVEFHWYAAEEVGLYGSKSIFDFYHRDSRPVKAMLNLDMVGYSGGHKAGSPIIAVQTDEFVNKDLSGFTKKLIRKYSKAEVGKAVCGYACSDHASAHAAGFPSAMIGESSYIKGAPGHPSIHSANDTIDHIDFDYMLEFAKVTAAFIAELAYANLKEL